MENNDKKLPTDSELKRFWQVLSRIEKGDSLNVIFRGKNPPMSNTLFYRLIGENSDLNVKYARAREIYADKIFDEILTISDHSSEDHTPFTGANVIQRDRLKIDARKWMLSKLAPKTYGDKLDIDHSTKGEKISSIQVTIVQPKEE